MYYAASLIARRGNVAMAIEILGVAGGVQPGQTATFTFQNEVMAYALGLSGFWLTYGDNSHQVQDLSIAMSGGQSGNQVFANVDAVLQDSSGHGLKGSESRIYPICAAVTGTGDPQTAMTNVTGIVNDSSKGVALPGASGYTALMTFLSGFALQYSTGDHRVLGSNAGCGISYDGTQGEVSSHAALFDDTGHQVNVATVDAGVIATLDAAPGFAVTQQLTTQSVNSVFPVAFPALPSVQQAFVLLQSWTVRYEHGHNVQVIAAGVWDALTLQGNNVVIPRAYAQVSDHTGHYQNNGESSVTLAVVAFPPPSSPRRRR